LEREWVRGLRRQWEADEGGRSEVEKVEEGGGRSHDRVLASSLRSRLFITCTLGISFSSKGISSVLWV
jgi:hypothetical protein